MNKGYIKLNIYFFIFVIISSQNLSARSNDSPNLEVIINQEVSWEQWIIETKEELKKKKFKESTINYLDNIKFNPRVIELDRKQPEFKLSFKKYLSNVVNEKNKKKINEHYLKQKELLKKIENDFKINSRILVALWGIETSFGEYTGKLDIIRSLASLAYEGRRKDFFFKELVNALLILEENSGLV